MEFKKVKDIPFYTIVLLCFVGLVFIPINIFVTNKIINISGIISLFFLIVGYKSCLNRSVIILAIAFLLLGSIDLLWYYSYKTNYVIYKNGYRGYLEVGKMLFFSFFILLFLTKPNYKVSIKFHMVMSILTQSIMFLVSCYQSLFLNADRIPLSAMNGTINQMGAATTAAYMILFCSLYSSIVLLQSQTKIKWPLFHFVFLMAFSNLIMTGTRSAILVFPFIVSFMIIVQCYKQKKILLKHISFVIILILVCGVVFNKDISNRLDAAKNDVTHYTDSNNSMSSIGARFAMINAGIISSPKGLEWQSLEQRADKVITLSKENNIYMGATEFLDVHMHNEIVEALSTKGITGVVTLLLFYIIFVYYCIANRFFLLLSFPVAIMLLGISDVLIHDKPIPASWLVTLLLSILLLNNKKTST